MYVQYAIVAIVLICASAYALRQAVRVWREAQSGCYGCKGCALKEQMMKSGRAARNHHPHTVHTKEKRAQNACWQKK